MNVAPVSPCYDRGAAAAPCRPEARPWVLATTILASSMVFIDGTVVNVALPALQRYFRAGASDLQWVVEAYALFLAALLLVGGAAGDRFGRRRVFLIGAVLFALASLCCALSASIAQLIAARALQGIGGALLVPGSLSLLSASFPESQRGKAIGTWSGFTAITAAIGPVIGGFLIEHYSWRLAFWLNLPLAMLVVPLALRFVPESREDQAMRAARLDWTGAALASAGLGLLVYGLIESSNRGWRDGVVLTALLLGMAMLAAFVVVEARSSAPMLPLALFRSRDFTGANLLTLTLYAALGGSLYFLPLNLIQVQAYSAVEAGAALLPLILLLFFLSNWSGGLVDRYGARRPLVIGPAIAALGFAGFALPGIGGSYWATYFPAVLVLGFGMAVSVAPLTTTVMNAVAAGQAGAASGVNNAVSRVAALLAVAMFGIVMNIAFSATLARELGRAQVQRQLAPTLVQQVRAQQGRLAAIELPAQADAQQRAVVKTAIGRAYVAGFRAVMLLSALLALASAVSAWIWISGPPIPGLPV